ncbi:MAG TPA: Gfo/Idh/MocA family oxidoreductase [Chloroflexota bacterium]
MIEHPLRCAVIGSGFAGSTYAEAIRFVPEARLVAVAGGRGAAELASQHQARAYTTEEVDAVLSAPDVDAVLIASPNPYHCPHTVRAAAHGKHVLVEKPMALTVAECRTMIDACAASGSVLMVGHHHRFRRNPVATRLLLDRGAIGRVDLVAMSQTEPDVTTWLTRPENGGYLLGSGIHGLDLLQWWLGDIVSVSALTGRYRGESVENGSLLLLEFANGTHGSFRGSVIPKSVPPPGSGVVEFQATLTGQLGVLHADMYGEVRQSTADGWQVHTALPVWDGHYAFLRMEAYAQQAREFVSAIRERRPPCYSAESALRAVAVVEAAHQAAVERRWVSIEEVLGH